MNLKIRKATIEDIDKGLSDLFIEGYRYHQNGRKDIFVNDSDEKLRNEFIEKFEKLSTILICDNDVIIGYLSYKIKEKHTKELYISQLVITEKYRRKGLGKKLIEEAKAIGISNNCNRIEFDCWVFNKNAIAMYEHLGFDRQRIIYEMKLDEE